jgi:deoxyribodipyrimidine photo-lyase
MFMHERVPEIRIRTGNESSVNPDGNYVLYWMIANRRAAWNFSLDRAVEWAVELKKPLVVLEALRTGYRWASDRLHQFVIQGMFDNSHRFAKTPVFYYPYVEQKRDAGKGLLAALGEQAAVVVSDDFPCFFLPAMTAAAAQQLGVRFELVDSNGLLPMRAAPKVFSRAFDLRRFLQKELVPHLADVPQAEPLSDISLPQPKQPPVTITDRWPLAEIDKLVSDDSWLARLPIDHHVLVASDQGGTSAAEKQLKVFVNRKLSGYLARNEPDEDVASGLSPWLHFGHISSHQIFDAVTRADGWDPSKVADKSTGSSKGWWGTSEPVESFLDELITWRELGYNMCWQRSDYDQFDSLPDWARQTLSEHAADRRSHVYDLEEFETARTHDALWNAAQNQLVREGRMHNYLRMLWGKKILEWTAHPRDALDVMIELNNKYALDGRNPNSYSGIFWVLGRYDRAWGPERPIFGKIRYMSSENTARKLQVKNYIQKFQADS